MSRKLIKPVTISDSRFIIVDSMKWHGRKIKRVFKTIDEKDDEMIMIRAVYENGRYVDLDVIEGITSEEEKDTVEFKDFSIDAELKDAPKDQADIIRREQIENFLWLNSHIKEKLPIGKIIKLLKQVPIKVYDDSQSKTKDATTIGYFDQDELFIAFANSDFTSPNRRERVSRFHEFIHYIQYMLNKEPNKILNDIFTEAQTESLAVSRDNIPRSRPMFFLNTRKPTMAIFNYPADCYIYSVSLLRQMEVIMGRKSYDKEFESDREFPNEFIKRYGKDLYTYLYAKMNALEFEKNDEVEANRGYYLSETQNKLMKEAFRQDFERMKTIEDAKSILTRLRELELQRVDIYVKEKNGEINELGHYEDYYNNIYQRIGNKLLKLGYSKEQIVSELKDYKYQEQEFNPVLPEEIFVERILKKIEKSVIKRFQKEEHQIFNPEKHKIVYAIYNNGDYVIGVSNRKNNKLLSLRYSPGVISSFDESQKFELTKDLINYLESPDALELKLPEQLDKKYRKTSNYVTKSNRKNANDGR